MRTTVTPIPTRRLMALMMGTALLLAGCATDKPVSNTLFDFGPATSAAAAGAPIGAVVVTDVTGSAALDSERMYYRLAYADALEARSYANSRWAATPLQLITQRIKVRLAQSGAKVLSATDASNGVPLLRIEVDDFNHTFDSAAASHGDLALRASLFRGHTLVDQRTFRRSTPAAVANAAGGAAALAASTDAVAADILLWLGALPAAQR